MFDFFFSFGYTEARANVHANPYSWNAQAELDYFMYYQTTWFSARLTEAWLLHHQTALAMARHPRLGAGSALGALSKELLYAVVCHAYPWWCDDYSEDEGEDGEDGTSETSSVEY
jgi:hypothetical protein